MIPWWITALLAIVLYLAGQAKYAQSARQYWSDHEFCPVCERLSERVVQEVRRMVAEEADSNPSDADHSGKNEPKGN